MPSTHQGAYGTCSPHRQLSGETQSSQVLQGQNQRSPKDQTGLKTWLGRAAWVMKSLCQGNPSVPAPALPWNRGDSCRGGVTSSIPPVWRGDTNHWLPQTPIPEHIQERFFLSPGICNRLMFAGNKASHRLAEEK